MGRDGMKKFVKIGDVQLLVSLSDSYDCLVLCSGNVVNCRVSACCS